MLAYSESALRRVSATLLVGVTIGVFSSQAFAQVRPRDTLSTGNLILWAYVVDYQNTPLSSVDIRYVTAGIHNSTATTRKDGSTALRGTEPGQIVRAEVDDPDWYCPDGPQEGEIGGRPVLFRVFHSNAAAMTAEERMAAHRARIQAAIRERREAALEGQPIPGDPLPSPVQAADASIAPSPTPKGQPPPLYEDPAWGYAANRHLIAFLAGLRYEEPQTFPTSADGTSTITAEAIIPVINGLGHPLADVAVDLFELKAGAGTRIVLAEIARTDSDGRVLFTGLTPSSWYRADCQTDDGDIGRSTVFKVQPGDTVTLRPIVVRPEDRALTGFITRAKGPAGGARVKLLTDAGESTLSTVADSEGYFVLGPLPPGPITLEVAHFGPPVIDLTLPIPPDRETPEVLLPLDALARDREPVPTPDKGL